jgi:hypothetical protein
LPLTNRKEFNKLHFSKIQNKSDKSCNNISSKLRTYTIDIIKRDTLPIQVQYVFEALQKMFPRHDLETRMLHSTVGVAEQGTTNLLCFTLYTILILHYNVGMHVDSVEFFEQPGNFDIAKTPLVVFFALEENTRIVVFDISYEDSLLLLSKDSISKNSNKIRNFKVKYVDIPPGMFIYYSIFFSCDNYINCSAKLLSR